MLIAEELGRISALLPSTRLSWRFPDAHTFVLPLKQQSLSLYNRPPQPRITLEHGIPASTSTYSGFQDLLTARATGELLSVSQDKLDRVIRLQFAATAGFVPMPAVSLVFELTGRNCNLILLDETGRILGAARDIGQDRNRFREVRSGLRYQPPPPYSKQDPRLLSEAQLQQQLKGKRIRDLRAVLDGIGPQLSKALALYSGISPEKPLETPDFDKLIPALQRLIAEPNRIAQEALKLPNLAELREHEKKQQQLEQLRQALLKELAILQKRFEDIEKTRQAALQADSLRLEADLLMAYAHSVSKNASGVDLPDFEGNIRHIQLDPQLNAIANAQKLYERARKRQARLLQAESREVELLVEKSRLADYLKSLEELPETTLQHLMDTYLPKVRQQERSQPGIRYQGPHGYQIIVGRNSRENDVVTFKLARSRDVWLHAQGYSGSHVIIQADSKEIPFETILFAAQLAAAYSKAGQSDNVPVDYSLRKHVWKPKGAAPGAVHYSQQKTVYVRPSRRPSES